MNEVSKDSKNKNFQQYCMYAIVCLFAFCYFHWKECGVDRERANNDSPTLEQIRVHSESIETGLCDIEQSTNSIAGTIETSERTLATAQQTIARIERNLNEATGIIAECRRILQEAGKESSTTNTP